MGKLENLGSVSHSELSLYNSRMSKRQSFLWTSDGENESLP
jgi:hypothetical protein